MLRLSFLALLICASFSHASPTLNCRTDLQANQGGDIKKWFVIDMDQDHRHRQPNQPPWWWTNLTFNIPYNATVFQVTAIANNATKYRGYDREVLLYNVDFIRGVVSLSLTWWSAPWTLYWGFDKVESLTRPSAQREQGKFV